MTDASARLAATERGPRDGHGGRSGPTVVFLHGLGCERGQFVRQFERLDSRLRLLSLDLPGHGDSLELDGAGTYEIATMTAVVGAELRARGHRAVVMVGHSAGGLIALRAAVDHPDIVRGIVLLDTNTALGETARRANRIRAEEAETGEWRDHFLRSMADSWGAEKGPDEHRRAEVFRSLRRVPEHVARPLWNDVLSFDSEPLWRRCPVPALYLRTRRDTDLALLVSLNPLVSALDLRGRCGGHWPHLQCPDPVNTAVQDFVARLDPDDG